MKRIFPILLLIIEGVIGLQLYAQKSLQVGISSQLQHTRILVDYTSTKVKGAYRPTNILFAEYQFGRHFSLHTGLGHTMLTQNSDAFKNNFQYLACPVYLKFGRLKDGRSLAFTSFVGMDVHYLIKANHVAPDGTRSDMKVHTQSFHSDVAGGCGLKIRLSDRYTLEGLISISHGSNISKDNAALMDINDLNTGYRMNLIYKF